MPWLKKNLINQKTVLLLDGKFYIYRALSANFSLTHKDINTTIYYNFLSALKAMGKKFKPDNIIIMWDSEYSKRKELYTGYKIPKNKNIDKNLEEQKRIIKYEYENVKKTLKAIGFASYLRHGYEADDLFFWYCNNFQNENKIIISRDEDLYQLLVLPNTKIYNPHEKIFITRKHIINKYGIEPEKWALFKAINGCKSDMVPGIPRIGDKYTLDYICQRATPKIVETIKDNWNIVSRNMFLVQLPFIYPPITKKLKPFKPKHTIIDLEYLKEFCFEMGFASFLKDLFTWKEIFKCKEDHF